MVGRTWSRTVGPSQWPPSYSSGGRAARPSSTISSAPSAEALAIARSRRPLGGCVDESAHPRLVDPELDVGGRLDDRVDEARRVAHDDEDTSGHAPLAGAARERVDDTANRERLVGIRCDDEVVLRATETERTFAERRGSPIDRAGNGGRADEPHGPHAGMVDERVHGGAIAVDNRKDPGRVSRTSVMSSPIRQGRQGHLLRRA